MSEKMPQPFDDRKTHEGIERSPMTPRERFGPEPDNFSAETGLENPFAKFLFAPVIVPVGDG